MANVISRAQRSHTVYASAARTATPDTAELELPGGVQYGVFVLDITAVTATPALTFKVEGVDRTSGKVFAILTEDAALTSTGTTTYRVGPGLTAANGAVANDFLPPVIRITVTHGDADSATYSLGAHFA